MTPNPIEKTRIKDRFRDISTLSVLIISSALVSLIVMDLLIFPLAIFSIKNKKIFNFIITDISRILILSLFIFLLVRRIYILKKNDFNKTAIVRHLITRPIILLSTSLVIILISLLIILIIYFLFYNNNYLLYRLLNM